MQKCAPFFRFYHQNNKKNKKNFTYQVAKVGCESITTRTIYRTQVSNLKNKLAILIRKP